MSDNDTNRIIQLEAMMREDGFKTLGKWFGTPKFEDRRSKNVFTKDDFELIQKAIDEDNKANEEATKQIEKEKKKKEKEAEKKPRFSIEVLKTTLDELGIYVIKDVIKNKIIFEGNELPDGKKKSMAAVRTFLYDFLSPNYTSATKDNITDNIMYLAEEHNYVLEELITFFRDDKDHLPELYILLGIEGDQLSQTLIHKWLLQCVCLLQNDEREPFGADGVLVLQGKQGLGKGLFLRHLATNPSFFHAGSINSYDKDTFRRCITSWICELSELDATFSKTIPGDLKEQLTADYDQYRLPYGREDEEAPRRTSFCGTVNEDSFLVDITGNRRFWVVPVSKKMTKKDLKQFDFKALWAQILEEAKGLSLSDCFRLTDDELEALEERNANHRMPVKAEAEIKDILADHPEGKVAWDWFTATTFKQTFEPLKRYSSQEINKALTVLGVRCKEAHNQKWWKLPNRVEKGGKS